MRCYVIRSPAGIRVLTSEALKDAAIKDLDAAGIRPAIDEVEMEDEEQTDGDPRKPHEVRLDALFADAFSTLGNHPAMHDYAMLKLNLKLARRFEIGMSLCPDHRDKFNGSACAICLTEHRQRYGAFTVQSPADRRQGIAPVVVVKPCMYTQVKACKEIYPDNKDHWCGYCADSHLAVPI